MADYAIWNGIAQGLQQGLLGWRQADEKRQEREDKAEEHRLRQLEMNVNLAKSGLQSDELGRVVETEASRQKQARDNEIKAIKDEIAGYAHLGPDAIGIPAYRNALQRLHAISTREGAYSSPQTPQQIYSPAQATPANNDALTPISGKPEAGGLLKVGATQNTSIPPQEATDEFSFDKSFKRKRERDLEDKITLLKVAAGLRDQGKPEKSSPGQMALDRTFAKEYDEWTSKDRSIADKNISQLEGTLKTLDDGGGGGLIPTSGRIIGRLPDVVKPEASIRMREDVRSAVMNTLRATLGPQFTEREGEQIFNLAYNEKLSPAENVHKLGPIIKQLKEMRDSKEAKSAYFEEHGSSLKGYKGAKGKGLIGGGNEIERQTKDGKTAIFDADTKQFIRYKD